MLDMQDIGYFLFMEQEEKKQREAAEQQKVNVTFENDLEREQPTHNDNSSIYW